MTSLSVLYDSFLSEVSDFEYISDTMTAEDVNEILRDYLVKAIRKFRKCKNSLKIIEVDGEEVFESELSDFEIEILTNLMVVVYLKQLVMAKENLKQALSDKDFKMTSQANQLKELRTLYNELKSEANKLITEYTYLSLDRGDLNA